MTINYYEILGLKENATEDEIRSAYKVQMKKWHPDINKSNDAVNMSVKINEAKEILLDPIKRKEYDDSLKRKEEDNYNKYTNNKTKTNVNSENINEKESEPKSVTKWVYLSDWLKYSNNSIIRKIISTIFVLIESFFCFLIKTILIIVSFICYILSDLIQDIYKQLLPIIGILYLAFFIKITTDGFDKIYSETPSFIIVAVSGVLIYISSYLLPVIGKTLLSKNVFNLLYNKLDVKLFKMCVGIK